ncbi:TPA: hypothetical protein ACGOWL_000545 [Streptococcus suis]
MRQNYFNLISENTLSSRELMSNLNVFENEIISGFDCSLKDLMEKYFKEYERNSSFPTLDKLEEHIEKRSKTITEKLFFHIELYNDFLNNVDFTAYLSEEEVESLQNHISFYKKMLLRTLEDNNHEFREIDGREVVCEKNAFSRSVSEIIASDNDSAYEAMLILDYNHFSNSKNLNRKREILRALANYLEPQRIELNNNLIRLFSGDVQKLKFIDNLFNKFNSISIRHENEEQITLQFNEKELKQIYDDMYNTILFLVLSRQQIIIQDKFDKDIKQRISNQRKKGKSTQK